MSTQKTDLVPEDPPTALWRTLPGADAMPGPLRSDLAHAYRTKLGEDWRDYYTGPYVDDGASLQLTLDAPAATTAPQAIPAQDICAGDWTYATGYREVQRVVRRPRRREIRIFWRSGAQTFRYDTILKVRKT